MSSSRRRSIQHAVFNMFKSLVVWDRRPKNSLLLDMLPPELILEVLGHLSYSDLKKRVPLVCKLFRDMVYPANDYSATTVDRILFKDAPSAAKKTQPCVLHPATGMVSYYFTKSIKDVVIAEPGSGFKRTLADTPIGVENASSPSTAHAVLHLKTSRGDEEPIYIDGTGRGGAVTMLDVMQSVVDRTIEDWEYWGRPGRWWTGIVRAEIVNGVLELYDDYVVGKAPPPP